ncbi:MAG: helix-turn-helix domain-containing protein [Clostridiaceae bacterium]|jgi:probable addiction module antidote protein|nr:helix-turn-helix domain-containing protein [Clostridiaceae bacterium]
MGRKFHKWNDIMEENFQKEGYSELYLEIAIEDYEKDGDATALMLAIKRIADAKGGVKALSERSNLNKQNLYKIFNNKTSPRFDTLSKILKALGYSFSIKSLNTSLNTCTDC